MADILLPILKIAMKEFLEKKMALDVLQETLNEVFAEAIIET